MKIQDLFPVLKKGWVGCDTSGDWKWYEKKPEVKHKLGWWINKEALVFGNTQKIPRSEWLFNMGYESIDKGTPYELIEVKAELSNKPLQLELF